MQFVNDAAKGRGISQEKLKKLADGRIFTGQKALKFNLIDRIGNLDDAVQWAGELAGVTEELVPIYPKEDKMIFLKKLAETLFKNIDITSSISDNFRYIIN